MTIKTASAFRRKRSALWVALIALVVVLFAGWLSAPALVAKAAQGPTPRTEQFLVEVDPDCERLGRCEVGADMVFAALRVNSLDSSLDAPNKYLVRGWFNLNWLPSAYPGWDPDRLLLGCRTRSSSCKFSGWQSNFQVDSGQRRIWGANFELVVEESDTFFNYPFDQHWIKIVIQQKDVKPDKFIDNIDIDSFRVQLATSLFERQSGGFSVDYATVSRKDNPSLIEAVSPGSPGAESIGATKEAGRGANSPGGSSLQYLTTSVSLHLVRRIPAALLMIITPLLLILMTTIIGFHWRESSPASRFGASGLLSAISLYFASRVFRPSVDYLVFSDIWFLLDYLAITANSVLLVWLFRLYKHRSQIKQAGGGAALAPVWKAENRLTLLNLIVVFTVLISLLAISHRMLRSPAIPDEFLAGHSGTEDSGISMVKVIERNELLPSYYLLSNSPE